MATITTINGSDLPSNSRADINTNFANLNTDKIETSVIDTDTALAANSDAKLPSQKAVKAYVDAGGNVNASETTKGIVEEATDAEVTAGTATGGTGAKLFVTPAKLATRLVTANVRMVASTNFETAARFTAILDSGTNTFNNNGVLMSTTSTTTRAAGLTWELQRLASSSSVFSGSPTFNTSFNLSAIGTTGSAYMGLGLVTKSGTGHTYTTDHCGFKIIISGSVATLYATQGDGATETASSALTTFADTDQCDVFLRVNSASSIDYFWQKNGGGWSSATNLTTNMPDTASFQAQFSISNNSTATTNNIVFFSASYSR
jgi:hypothetical protein